MQNPIAPHHFQCIQFIQVSSISRLTCHLHFPFACLHFILNTTARMSLLKCMSLFYPKSSQLILRWAFTPMWSDHIHLSDCMNYNTLSLALVSGQLHHYSAKHLPASYSLFLSVIFFWINNRTNIKPICLLPSNLRTQSHIWRSQRVSQRGWRTEATAALSSCSHWPSQQSRGGKGWKMQLSCPNASWLQSSTLCAFHFF